jgi:hypothetical protein
VAELITGAGSAPAPASGGEAQTPSNVPAGTPTVLTTVPETPAPAEKGPSLADVIRQEREARQARAQEAARAKDWETKYRSLESEMERVRRDSDFEADPVAYAKARGWDKEKQALMGQTLLYDLVPDKAPPDLRIRLFESAQARKEREAKDNQEKAQREAQERQAQETYHSFVAAVDQAVDAIDPGSFPETEAWFGEDRDTFVRSAVATAVNMASVAQREGRVADLSPASIFRTLEAEVARKMKARDERVQRRAKPAQPAPQQPQGGGGMQPTESTKGTYGSGAPAPKAQSERERLDRAIAAAFKPR